jgi:transposase
MKVRVVKTASNAQAVQVVGYHNNKRKVIKHVGSANTEVELQHLLALAHDWIIDFSQQHSIFPQENPNQVLHISHSVFVGIRYNFFHVQITSIIDSLGLITLHTLLRDLVVISIFEPASKLRSIELMEQFFGIKHHRKTYYKLAPTWLNLKQEIESKVITFAQQQYEFNYDILFYDVTTLYFETFEEDELRKNGFSKDNKSQQPQILIALMVSKEGFPISYEVFVGNTFEGHTIIPVIKNFIQKNQVKDFTVVADAAMISSDNIKQLIQNQINYIVGARLGNIAPQLLNTIDKELLREDGKNIRIKTENGDLICSYSSLRYRKDFYEMNKQLEKAKQIIEKPSKTKKVKFTSVNEAKIELNEPLIEKTKKLLGVKGYYTNLAETKADNKTIIEHYHQLYRIEQAFRISKNDLQTRPIFHYKEEPIKLHLLICCLALVVSKHIELKAHISIRKFSDELKKVTDGQILNTLTNKIINLPAKPNQKLLDIISKISPPH